MHNLRNLGYKNNELNEQSYIGIINGANHIAKLGGKDFHKEITDKNTDYSQEAKNLTGRVAHNLDVAAKELDLNKEKEAKKHIELEK